MHATDRFDPIIGSSEVIHDLRSFVIKMSELKAPILLMGPPGVGKRLAVRKMHAAGPVPGARLLNTTGPEFCLSQLRATEDEIPALVQMGTVYIGQAHRMTRETAQGLKDLLMSCPDQIPRIVLGVDSTEDHGEQRMPTSSPLTDLELGGYFFIPPLKDRPEDITTISRYQVWSCSRPEEFEERWKEFTLKKLGEILTEPWNGNVPELMTSVQAFCNRESERSGTANLGNLSESVSAHWLQEQIDRMHESLMERWTFEASTQGDLVSGGRRTFQ